MYLSVETFMFILLLELLGVDKTFFSGPMCWSALRRFLGHRLAIFEIS